MHLALRDCLTHHTSIAGEAASKLAGPPVGKLSTSYSMHLALSHSPNLAGEGGTTSGEAVDQLLHVPSTVGLSHSPAGEAASKLVGPPVGKLPRSQV